MPYKNPQKRKEKAKEYRIKFLEKNPDYFKDYFKKNGHKYAEYHRNYLKKYWPNWVKGNKKYLEKRRTYYRKNSEKNKARYTLYNAIVSGHVIRETCEVCGKPHAEGHHSDYSQPLKVTWLCGTHHRALHNKKIST